MSLARRTPVAAAAVTTLVLTLAATLLPAAAGPATAAGRETWREAGTRTATAERGSARAARGPAYRSVPRSAYRSLPVGSRTSRAAARQRAVLGAQPVLGYRGVADPTVARYAGGWVAVATGPGAPRAVAPEPGGPWSNIDSALTVQPSWAVSRRYWASDLVEVGGVWLLYFSAEVAGLGLDGRCIGVAVAADPTAPFVPDERPVVCPKQASAPGAYDKIKRRGRDMPKSGVIDPDLFRDRGGRLYLTYRTQSTPSSIRMVEVPASGRPVGSGRSTELVRRSGVIENPALVRRGRQYVLLTSEDEFGDCGYKTTFRRSVKLTDWSRSKRQVLVDTKKSGLCGPGGADVVRAPGGGQLMFLHAWTCPALGGNCPAGNNYDRNPIYDARRALFAASLRFTKRKSPRIASYVTPILPPPPPPTPTPTPTPTPSPSGTPTVTIGAQPQG